MLSASAMGRSKRSGSQDRYCGQIGSLSSLARFGGGKGAAAVEVKPDRKAGGAEETGEFEG
jgi:hypothetical protein